MTSNTPNAKPILAIIDGFSFLFRAFYGVRHLSTSEGLPTNALYGFAQMLIKVTKDLQPHCCVVALEGEGEGFRRTLYPDYKANRSAAPEELIAQIPLLEPMIKAFDIPAVHEATFEADDVIATLARQYSATHTVVIISSDKDLMQLINDSVYMLDTMKNKEIRAPEVFEKFGVGPDKVIEVQALIGDSSDNIPGVPSIGPKTAAELIQQFGTIENLYKHVEELPKSKRKEKIIENEDLAHLSKKLVTLDQNLPLNLSEGELRFHPTLDVAAKFLTEKLEFDTLANRLVNGNHFINNGDNTPPPVGALNAHTVDYNTHPFSRFSTNVEVSKNAAVSKPTDLSDAIKTTYTAITTEAELDAWLNKITAAKQVCIDTETTHLTAANAELVGISLAVTAAEAAYIPLMHKTNVTEGFDFGDAPQNDDAPAQLSTALVLEKLRPILADATILKIAQNLKYDWQVLAKAYGISPINDRAEYHTFIANYADTMLQSFCLHGGEHGNGMDFLSEKYLGIKPIPFKEVCGTGKAQITFDYVDIDKATTYAAEDADLTLRLFNIFNADLTSENNAPVHALYEKIERPLIPILAAMEHTGVAIDKAELARLSLKFQQQLEELETDIHALAGEPFNIASPKQLGEILFDKLQIPSPKKNRSTNVDVLEKLASDNHPIANKVLAYRSAAKLKSTYTDALAEKTSATSGRIHTHYHQAGAGTGRFSSSDPNLQNIPTRTEEGRAIRKAFIASDGYWLSSLDYSQIELRLLAHFSDSAPLLEAFNNNADIHATTAGLIFGADNPLPAADQRRVAKMINFGIVYGMGPLNLAKQTGFSRAEATTFIDTYFARYSGVRSYMTSNKEAAAAQGYVTTLMGRRVHLPGINSSNGMLKSGAERAAINAPLQGSNADVIKKAMIDIQDFLIAGNHKTRMLMQVHDELIFEGPEDERGLIADLKKLMENAVQLKVPLKVEGETAANWADAH